MPEDENGFINVIARPDVYAKYRKVFCESPLLIVAGEVQRQGVVVNLIAEQAVRAIRQQPADLIATDCPLAGVQLDQAGASAHAGGKAALHPIQVVRDAYGLPK